MVFGGQPSRLAVRGKKLESGKFFERADIPHRGEGVVIPEDAIIFVGYIEGHGYFGIILEQADLMPHVIELAVLVLTQAIEGLSGLQLKGLSDGEGGLSVINDRGETAAVAGFFHE